VGQLLKKADIGARKFLKNFKISRRQFFENENVRDGQIANSTIVSNDVNFFLYNLNQTHILKHSSRVCCSTLKQSRVSLAS
jgi:hypothetical protein